MKSFEEMLPLLQGMGRVLAKYSVIDRTPFDFGVGMKLHPAEIHLVSAVEEHRGVGVTQLAQEFGVTKGAISQQVAKLVKKGLLSKQAHPGSQAKVVIRTTALGKAASDNHMAFHREHDTAFFEYLGALSDDKYATVTELVEEMNNWMDTYLK